MSEANTPLIGGNIANIERAKVVTIETSPKTYIFDTATSATYTAARALSRLRRFTTR